MEMRVFFLHRERARRVGGREGGRERERSRPREREVSSAKSVHLIRVKGKSVNEPFQWIKSALEKREKERFSNFSPMFLLIIHFSASPRMDRPVARAMRTGEGEICWNFSPNSY